MGLEGGEGLGDHVASLPSPSVGGPGSSFNILIVLLTQWNEISWRNARAITQNHSSVRHAAVRPSVRPSVRPPGKRRGELVGPSSLHRLSSNRPPASGGPLNERAASRLKKDEEDGER